jgi:hypothetical protein
MLFFCIWLRIAVYSDRTMAKWQDSRSLVVHYRTAGFCGRGSERWCFVKVKGNLCYWMRAWLSTKTLLHEGSWCVVYNFSSLGRHLGWSCARSDPLRPDLWTKVIPSSCIQSVCNFHNDFGNVFLYILFDMLDPVALVCSLSHFSPKNCYLMITEWTETFNITFNFYLLKWVWIKFENASVKVQ